MNSLLLLLLLSCTLMHACVHAAYFNVNTCTEQTPCVFVTPTGSDSSNTGTMNSPFRTIQQALSMITTNVTVTTIVLADGMYPGNIVWSGSNITLTSINGASSTFIDCNKIPNQRGIWIGSSEISIIISGVTIRNCKTNMGAGMSIVGENTKIMIRDVQWMNNMASMSGGAISIQQGASVNITRCTFVNNTAAMNGGGVMIDSTASVMITSSLFDSNQASQGSIVYNDANSRATITGCTARHNVALQQGGIYLLNPASAANFNPSSNTYANNKALGGYGSDYASYANALTFTNDEFSTDVGYSGVTPSQPGPTSPQFPHNVTTTMSHYGFDLESSSFTLILVMAQFLVLDTFGQRYACAANNTNYYTQISTVDNVNTSLPGVSSTMLPQMLFQNTQMYLTNGMAFVTIVIVGEMAKTYAIDFSIPLAGVTPVRIIVAVKPCAPLDVVTLFQGSFPICHHPETHYVQDSLFIGVVVVSCILIVLVLIVQGLTIWFWNTPVFKGSTPLFMSLMLFGAIIGYLATILSVMDINHTGHFDAVCKSQYWMMGIAFVLMFGTLALKTWRIRNIFCNESLSEIRRNVSTISLLRWLGLLIVIEMLIHILWISIDPLDSSLQLTSDQSLTSTCTSQHSDTFLIINLVYKGLIAAVCVGYAYQTRDVASRFNESRQLMVASYNMFVCVIVIAALALSLPSMDARRTAYSVGALMVITSTWCVLFIPKLYIAIYKPHEHVPSMGAPGSNGKNSNSGTGTTNSGKPSTGKSTQHMYNNTAPQSSKSSFNNGIMMSSIEYGSSSKGGSSPNTATGSPIIPHAKLQHSPQNTVIGRVSVSSMGSPLAMGIMKGSSPLLQSSMLSHIPRHMPIPRPLHVDDMTEHTTSTTELEPLPTPGPDMINVQTPPPSSRQGGLQPAKNFI